MRKMIVNTFFCICLLLYFSQTTLAQQKNSITNDEIVVALSKDEDFKNFYLENIRFIKLKETNAITGEEEKNFHAEQNERVKKINARFPELSKLDEMEAVQVRKRAWAIIDKMNKNQ